MLASWRGDGGARGSLETQVRCGTSIRSGCGFANRRFFMIAKGLTPFSGAKVFVIMK
jgi:hypothetical protein